MVLGNGDAHAKNFSLLHRESGAVELAPAYDIMSTAYYPRADVRPAMSVNGKVSLHEISAQDVVEEAASWGYNRNRAAARVAELLGRLPAAFARAALDVPTAPKGLVELVRGRAAAFASA